MININCGLSIISTSGRRIRRAGSLHEGSARKMRACLTDFPPPRVAASALAKFAEKPASTILVHLHQ